MKFEQKQINQIIFQVSIITHSHPVSSLHVLEKGEKWKHFSWTPKSLWEVTAAMKLKDACSLEKICVKPIQCLKKQKNRFVDKGPSSQIYDFSSSHVGV